MVLRVPKSILTIVLSALTVLNNNAITVTLNFPTVGQIEEYPILSYLTRAM